MNMNGKCVISKVIILFVINGVIAREKKEEKETKIFKFYMKIMCINYQTMVANASARRLVFWNRARIRWRTSSAL